MSTPPPTFRELPPVPDDNSPSFNTDMRAYLNGLRLFRADTLSVVDWMVERIGDTASSWRTAMGLGSMATRSTNDYYTRGETDRNFVTYSAETGGVGTIGYFRQASPELIRVNDVVSAHLLRYSSNWQQSGGMVHDDRGGQSSGRWRAMGHGAGTMPFVRVPE